MTGAPTQQQCDRTTEPKTLLLFPVEPQPDYIESSGRWHWPLPPQACFPGCCTSVVTASREWWEYAPSEAKPHAYAEGVRLRDDIWYWAVPSDLGGEGSFALRFATMWSGLVDSPSKHLLRYTNAQRFMYEADERIESLLALAKQYASECAGCRGRGFTYGDDGVSGRGPDDVEPTRYACEDCADICAVIAKAEGRGNG